MAASDNDKSKLPLFRSVENLHIQYPPCQFMLAQRYKAGVKIFSRNGSRLLLNVGHTVSDTDFRNNISGDLQDPRTIYAGYSP